jgi:hypothetical protein
MVLSFDEYIAWLGDYSLSDTGHSGNSGAKYPEARAAGAQIYVEASGHSDGEIREVWPFRCLADSHGKRGRASNALLFARESLRA